MFDIGFQELIIIFVVALIVVGPKKLPELGRTLGKWVVDIRRSINMAKSQIEDEMKDEFKMPEDIVQSLPKDIAEDGKTVEKKDDAGEGKS
ncbi:MAG: twin-arginine translocase subunit TatB [Nitrospiraceae bacterium]|jgi:Tat protein translocase TatB subunit|nr:MAG: twin-arginine translocase subunit TatB [Nitrospiraceae bacterium]